MKTISFAEAQADFELRRIEQKCDDMFGEPEENEVVIDTGYDYDPALDEPELPQYFDRG